MASPYARMTDWLDWQRPYRLGVLLVLPPGRVRKEVNELRARYDPRSQAAAEAHVSLTVPFQKEPDHGLWSELDRVASSFRPFTIHYGPLVSFLPKPGAALDIEPKDALDRLRRALETCEVFAGAGPRPYPFWPHMTIAEFVSVDATKELVRQIGGDRAPVGSFVCDHLSYLVPDESLHFTERRVVKLGP
jgi:2'-5' RNA ligase